MNMKITKLILGMCHFHFQIHHKRILSIQTALRIQVLYKLVPYQNSVISFKKKINVRVFYLEYDESPFLYLSSLLIKNKKQNPQVKPPSFPPPLVPPGYVSVFCDPDRREICWARVRYSRAHSSPCVFEIQQYVETLIQTVVTDPVPLPRAPRNITFLLPRSFFGSF